MKRNRKRLTWSQWMIVASAIIVIIPLTIVGIQGIKASFNRGKPVVGNRFNDDLDPKINNESLDKIVAELKQNPNIKNAQASIKTATLRVYIESDASSNEAMEKVLDSAYEIVTKELDPDVYFKIKGIQKQYDLEIHGYNMVPKKGEEQPKSFVYSVLTKTSNMAEPGIQVMTTPRSQDIVDFFYAEEKRKDEALKPEEPTEPKEPAEQEDVEEGDGE